MNERLRVHGSRGTIGQSFSGRDNSLNFLRIVLALVVLISHAVPNGNLEDNKWILFNGTGIGTVAVYGFFGISGFLIAGSAERNRAGRYLWQRFLRIFPGFWVCLVITAFVLGLIGWLVQSSPHCGISCYLQAKQSPFDYVFDNSLLRGTQVSIAGTPAWPNLWNASLWTLFYEFLCYLLLMMLALLGLLRNRIWALALTMSIWTMEIVGVLVPSFNREINLANNATEMYFLKLATIFMVGAVIFLYRDRVPDSGWLALICAGVFVAGIWLPTDGHAPEFALTASDLLSPFIAYPLLWLGIHLPFKKVGARNDYSYGLYIYAYPVTVLLAICHAERLGEPAFIALCIVGTVPFALASWWLVEKRALSLKKFDPTVVTTRILGPKRPGPSGPTDPAASVAPSRAESDRI
jgi:peptidoglycan/LPS O-acetylase OafA/YrhL